MGKLNFKVFEKMAEVVISEKLMAKINGGDSDGNTVTNPEDTTEGVRPLAKGLKG